MIGIGMCKQGVPRQGFPKPQVLTDLGDKGKVLEYLMSEWYEIQELQVHDAPALVAYLVGDPAVRQDRMLDAFRNAAAQRSLEMLWNAIRNGVVFEADIAKYQGAYDQISALADATAQASMKMLGEYMEFRERRESLEQPERTRKVALGDCWRSKRHDGATLRVTAIQVTRGTATLGTATLEGQGGIENAGNVSTMFLDENGFCVDPEGNWKLFSCEIKEPRSLNFRPSPPPSAEVEVGQRWLRRTKDGSTGGIVISVEAGSVNGPPSAALLSTVTPGYLMRMALDEARCPVDTDMWSLAETGISALAKEEAAPAASGDRAVP